MISMFPLLAASPADPPSEPVGAPAAAGDSAAPKPLSKVELDLEGAPFLEPDEPAPQAAKDEAPPVPLEAKPGKSRKKLFVAGGLVLLLALGAAAYFFLFAGEGGQPEPGKEVVVVHGPDWGQSETSDFMIEMPAFWVELADPQGEVRFLVCQFVIPSNSNANMLEINAKMPIIRDAIYYYLRNKSYAFLMDNTRQAEIKKDVAGIISDYLMSEKIEEVLLDTYIIK